MASVTAIVIARSGSNRLPNKNMLDFYGQPLVARKVQQLSECRLVDRIVVGSDSQDILDAATKNHPIVMKRLRKPEFCDEKSRSWNEVIADMAAMVPGEIILWAHCTNPLIRPQTYDKAILKYLEEPNSSLLSVTRVQSHVWYEDAPLNYDPYSGSHPVAAQVKPVFFQNGGIFIWDRKAMIVHQYVFGKKPYLFEIDADEAIDIDTQQDYARALSLGIAAEEDR
jgi:N-acylneuraminate cytidylyltransferase/CMP-N,N'-diacetyllegionaminic acid synthase